jgi:glycogen debranching enzyme
MRAIFAALYLLMGLSVVCGVSIAQTGLHAVEIPLASAKGPVLTQRVIHGEPFTVAGPRGVLVGQQQGELEAWLLPVKLFSHLTVEAQVEGYPVPIDLNQQAREIEVRPESTTITYSHIAVVVRQTMFAADEMPAGTGAVILFQVDSPHAVDLTVRLTPEMREMWPKLSSVAPGVEWVAQGGSGYYLLHTDVADLTGAIAIPGAVSGILAPYQERPQFHPLEFKLHVAPTDRAKQFPLLMAVGRTKAASSSVALLEALTALNVGLPALYAKNVDAWRKREAERTAVETPDEKVNAAFSWAETSIEQLRADSSRGDRALVAGYFASGDSARPGFGWFFGRDALFTLYAVNGFGDFALSQSEFEFLIKRERADGKIMHEYSQTADEMDWAALPYEYAAADSTPLFLTALLDYVKASGDVGFLKQNRDAVLKAWEFETTHDADGDGIYDNAQGTGWVESWPPGMPKQEIYLASMDEQASRAMGELGALLGEDSVAATAKKRAETVHATLEREYYRPATGEYAFSWNGGILDETRTMFPAIAWWNGGAGLEHKDASLKAWASHAFATDWGQRDVASTEKYYDGMSYHQGSVWPLFTGWQALAEYRGGQPLAGYQSAMENVDLTTAQDVGAVTELLSGDYFEPFGRSTSHQLWSSAMVITPILRGMFGIEVDALNKTLHVMPKLPADWKSAAVRRVHVGDAVVDIVCLRSGRTMLVSMEQQSGAKVTLAGADKDGILRVALPAVEVSVGHGLPLRGSRTSQMKVLHVANGIHSSTFEVEGQSGSTSELKLVRNDSSVKVQAEGGTLDGDRLMVNFSGQGDTEGYVGKTVTLRW